MLCEKTIKDLSPGTPDFFISSANAHALSNRRQFIFYDARKERATHIDISDVNIEYIFENLRNIKIDYMHYGHSIKCRYHLDGIFTIQSSVGRSIDSPFFKCINMQT